MSAELKLYSDSGCTTELSGGAPYTIRFGAVTGLNGTAGESSVTSIWVKNTGTILISNVVLNETADVPTRGSYSLDGTTYNNTTITLGDMATSGGTQIVRVYCKVTVAPGTAVAVDEALSFSIGGTHLA
jgi:hypothetical protein